MTREEYIPLALRTLASSEAIITPDQMEWDIIHAVIGINTEIGELSGAVIQDDMRNVREEIGDIFWYCAVLDYTSGIPMNVEIIRESGIKDIRRHLSMFRAEHLAWTVGPLHRRATDLLDAVKKRLFYGSPSFKSDEFYNLVVLFTEELSELCSMFNINIGVVRKKNIHKLKIRYPQKFTSLDALNRDLDEEKKALGGD